MNYYLDTEFEDAPLGTPIRLISLGLVAEDGREFYGEIEGAAEQVQNPWVLENVVSRLAGPKMSPEGMRVALDYFVRDDPHFFGYFSAYDWVLFCQIWGGMLQLPNGWPQRCSDLAQLCAYRAISKDALPPEIGRHHALVDARWTKDAWKAAWSIIGQREAR